MLVISVATILGSLIVLSESLNSPVQVASRAGRFGVITSPAGALLQAGDFLRNEDSREPQIPRSGGGELLGGSLTVIGNRTNGTLPILGNKTQIKWTKEMQEKAATVGAIQTLIQVSLMLLFAYFYKSKVVDLIPTLDPIAAGSRGKDFHAGLCACFDDQNLCLHAICCSMCRAAHTYAVAGVLTYLQALALQVVCSPCMCFVGGCFLRPRLRAAVGLEEDGFMDCLKWTCCSVCAIGQEALEVDELSGIKVLCCCNALHVGDHQPLQPLEEPLLDAPAQQAAPLAEQALADEPPSQT